MTIQGTSKLALERLEGTLTVAENEWASLPQVEAEIDTWDLLEQLEFTETWPLAEMRLDKLAASVSLMTPEQHRCYEGLLEQVQTHRPILDRLLR